MNSACMGRYGIRKTVKLRNSESENGEVEKPEGRREYRNYTENSGPSSFRISSKAMLTSSDRISRSS